ncbi:MAG: glycosyltransferase family 39 protein [bacterium]|nr:glycosyltransferase family 39 protein [bacterium]
MTQKPLRQSSQADDVPPIYWFAFLGATGAGAILMWLYIAPATAVVYVGVMLAALIFTLRYDPPTRGIPGILWRGVLLVAAHRLTLSRVIAAAGLGAMVVAAFLLSVGRLTMVPDGYSAALIGGGLFVVAVVIGVQGWPQPLSAREKTGVAFADDLSTRETPQVAAWTMTRWHWLGLIGGLVMMALVTEINADLLGVTFLQHARHHVQFVLLVAGILLSGWGLSGTVRRGTRAKSATRTRQPLIECYGETLALVLIVGFAFAVRAWQLGDAVRLFVDEIHFSNPVRHFFYSNHIELLMPFSSVAAFPYVYPYLQWNAVELFGRTLEGLRIVSVLFGVAGVGTLYLLARELYGRRVGLLAAALLAAFPPHLQFSRLGLNNIADPTVGTLALYFVARGMRRPQAMPSSFAWAGVMLGLTQYFYEGGRLLYPVLAGAWLFGLTVLNYAFITAALIWSWAGQERKRFQAAVVQIERVHYRRLAQSALVLVLAGLLVGGPIYLTLMGKDREVIQRLETAGLRPHITDTFVTPGAVLTHVQRRLNESLLVHVSVQESGLYYGGDTSLLLGFMTVFFLIGVTAAGLQVFRPMRSPGGLLLLLWLAFTWMGNTLMQDSRISARYVVEYPALMLLVALGLHLTVERLFPVAPGKGQRSTQRATQNRLLLGAATALVVAQTVYFFGPHLERFNVQFRSTHNRGRDVDDALLRSVDFPAGTYIHIIDEPQFPDRDAVDLLNYLRDGLMVNTMTTAELTEAYMQALPVDHAHAFFVKPEAAPVIAMIRRYFPEAHGPQWSDHPLPDGRMFALYFVDRLVDAGKPAG